ncbi:MAG: right-handed parallel beta-helix repeat-containing protein [Lachnospiraceae bacterium]|nr:right-handed parallel beta-helix repeat-containing protein [Lachnospiraceae bacterium]
MKKRFFKRFLSLVISLCLIVGGLGVSPMELQAEGESTTGTVIYVGGEGASNENDGLTEQTSVKTLKAAYSKVPVDNVKSTIVVMSELQLAPDEAPLVKQKNESNVTVAVANSSFTGNAADYLDWSNQVNSVDMYKFPSHAGEVVITSKDSSGALNFNGKAFALFGNTTIENIKITEAADCIYARFNDFSLGEGLTAAEGVTYYPATSIYMGTGTNLTYTTGAKVVDTKKANLRDKCFTMKSGSAQYVYGGSRSWNIDADTEKTKDTTLVVNGGSISELWGTSLGSVKNQNSWHKNINITLNGGKVGTVYGAHAGTQIAGNVTITVVGEAEVTSAITALSVGTDNGTDKTAILAETSDLILNLSGSNISIPAVNNGFKHLGLNGSDLTIAGESVEKVDMTDDSTLTFTSAPTNAVNVYVTNNDDTWNTTTALITAPTSTGYVFNLTAPEDYSLTKAEGESVTWTLTAPSVAPTPTPTVSPEVTPTENVVYVDGVNGLDTNDGLTEDKPVKTLKAAYSKGKVLADNETKTIVIMSEIQLAPDEEEYTYDSNKNSATYKKYNKNEEFVEGSLDLDFSCYLQSNYLYKFPKHDGAVVITSKIGETVFENGALNFNGKAYALSGNTAIENIKISGAAEVIYARYHDLTLGKNLTAGAGVTYYPAKMIYMGIGTNVSHDPATNNKNVTDFKYSEARAVCFIMNSGNLNEVYGGNRSWEVTTAGQYDTKLVVNGGNITTLYGTSQGSTKSPHKNIEIALNGGAVTTLYGAYAQDSGGPTILGDVKITLTENATVSSKLHALKVQSNGAKASVTGDTILNLSGSNCQIPSDISGFNCLGLTGCQLSVADTTETGLWGAMKKVEMTDDSTLTFTQAPTKAVTVTVKKASDAWNMVTPLITAPAQTGNLFTLSAPFGYELAYNAGVQDSWTLGKATELQFGERMDSEGAVMDIDLKLPKTYTPLDENATAYETYLQKVADLEAAVGGKEVPVVSPVEVKGEVAIYVDPVNGKDSYKGTKAEPLATIQKALDHVAALQTSEEPFKGIVVYLKGGTYNVTETISITSAHSGKNQIPVIISAYDNEEVIISGGNQIAGSAFKAVSEISTESYSKLPAAVRDEVVAVSLTDLGISTANAKVTKDGPNYQVFVDGEELTLSRYPNVTKLALLGKVEHIGYINYNGDSMGNKGDNADDPDIRFEMTDLRPTLWENDGKIWLRGSLYAEWLNQHIRVKDINAVTGIITMDGGTDRGAKTLSTNTYYYYNILEELDVPGEFYLDTEAGILYMYPISDMSTAMVTYSYMQDNIINLTETENVVLNGLTVENGANLGIYMTGCKETLVQNCTLRNLYQGARIHGEQSGIIYSEICKTMDRPVTFSEYDVDYDYSPEENFLQNCYIHTVGTGGSGAVYIQGTGNVVSHNLLQGNRSVAIYLAYTKECIIEYNEITGSPSEVFDQGAIYSPHNIRSRGTHVRYNYIHDIGVNSKEPNPQAIYFDEGTREHYAYGNILENVPRGIYTNSGSENVIVHNIVANGGVGSKQAIHGSDNFKDYTLAVRYARSSTTRDMYNDYMALSEAKKAEVKERYPLLVKYYDDVTAAIAATGDESGGVGLYASQRNYVHENLIYNHGIIDFTDLNDVADNIVATSNPFTNVDAHDFTFTDPSLITWEDKLPDMDNIGILTKENSKWPAKEAVGAFGMYAPSNGNQKVDPFKVLLKWSAADGADEYILKISKNADMSDARTMNNISRHRFGYFEQDEFFDYDTTYYWTVTADTVAKSRIAGTVAANNGAVYSFKTMNQEEYLEANPLDTTALEETIADAETLLAQVTDESNGGLYADGTHEALEAAITAAEAVMNNLGGKDQVSVNQARVALENAIYVAKTSREIQYITFDELSAEDWAPVSGKELNIKVEGDELQFITEAGSSDAMYNPGLGIRDVLCFQYKIDHKIAADDTVTWHGFPIAKVNPNAGTIANATDGYFICIEYKAAESQLYVQMQKRQGGKKVTQLDKKVDTSIYSGGGYYDIEIGAINNPDGSVGIHFKINDAWIFDPEVVVDTTEDKVIEGFGQAIVGTPFVETPTFGVYAHKSNGIEYLKQSAADYTALDAEIAQADALAQSDYTEASWSAYQALLDEAEALAANLAKKEQTVIDELTAELKAAREALVEAPSSTPTPTPSATPTPSVTPTAAPSAKPEITESGTADVYTKGSGSTVSIHCTGELNKLTEVKMDSQKVDEANYTLKEGSTIVTFKESYLETLSVGEHTVTLVYQDGNSIDSKLTILEQPANEDTNEDADDTQDEDTSGEDNNDNAETTPVTAASGSSTGDDSNLILWIVLLACATLMCGFIALKAKKVKK